MIVVTIIALLLFVQMGRLVFKVMTASRTSPRAALTPYEQRGQSHARRASVTSEQPRRRRSRHSYQQQLAEAIERYDAEQRAEEARIQSLPYVPIAVIPLRETDGGRIGVGADGELVEIDPPQANPADNLTDV